MSRHDKFHDLVVNALKREGWVITNDPYLLTFGAQELKMDLGAEMPIGAEREGVKIAVEIKSFLSASALTDFCHALGQFTVYRTLIEQTDATRTAYLAMPRDAYRAIFDVREAEIIRVQSELRLIIYNPSKEEEPLQWIL